MKGELYDEERNCTAMINITCEAWAASVSKRMRRLGYYLNLKTGQIRRNEEASYTSLA